MNARRGLGRFALVALLLTATAAGLPANHVVDGVDLGEASFPSGKDTIHLHGGSGNNGDNPNYELRQVWSGRVGGQTVAVARIRALPPATGYDDVAEAYLISGGKARWLATVGGYSYFNDTGPNVDPWLFISFTGDHLNVDQWDDMYQCVPNGNWLVTTYALRGGKLVTLYATHHHRAGTPAYRSYQCTNNLPYKPAPTPAPIVRRPVTYAITLNGKLVLPHAMGVSDPWEDFIWILQSDLATATGGIARPGPPGSKDWILRHPGGFDEHVPTGDHTLTYRGAEYIRLDAIVGSIRYARLTAHGRAISVFVPPPTRDE